MNQQISSFRDRRQAQYPYCAFVVREAGGEGKPDYILELDFVRQVIVFHLKDHSHSEYSFHQISCVVRGLSLNQFVIEFRMKRKQAKIVEAVYPGQRDQILKMLIYASEVFQLPLKPAVDSNFEEVKAEEMPKSSK